MLNLHINLAYLLTQLVIFQPLSNVSWKMDTIG